MAAAQLAVDGLIEHGQIPDALLHLKPDPDRPDVLRSQWLLRAGQLPLYFMGFDPRSGFPNGPLGVFVSQLAEGVSIGRLQPRPLAARSRSIAGLAVSVTSARNAESGPTSDSP
jgi:hypothetical protein